MAKFVKGDWVEVCPYPDYNWEQWVQENSDLCGKTGKITKITEGDWVDEIYIEVEYRGNRIWFKDSQLIKVKNYAIIFSEAIHEACEKLQRHEKICKKLRDEILHEVFGDESVEMEKPEYRDIEQQEKLFSDWEELTTKEIIPLPGNGGTMTSPDDADPKAAADSHRKKARKIKSLGGKKKIIKKGSQKKLVDSWTLSDEDIKELEEYLDTLPYSNIPSQAGDYDYEYDDLD
jgi:hypothetical protein|tara:strand:- start:308 stop:1003 length:696 start_codon:yes stop_codon:yes gene_type:complete